MSRRPGGIGFQFRPCRPRRDGTNSFGFSGHETYPIDDGISQLHAADLTGDGLNDLIVVNNLRSKSTCSTTRPARPTRPRNRSANSKSTNCRPARASALIPFPRMSASPRWRWPTSTATAGRTSFFTATRRTWKSFTTRARTAGASRNAGTSRTAHGRERAGHRRFERRRPPGTSFCSATTARFISCRSSPTTRWRAAENSVFRRARFRANCGRGRRRPE